MIHSSVAATVLKVSHSSTSRHSQEEIQEDTSWCRVLVVGAGGLGVEIVKGLVLYEICSIDVIDMDTVSLTNLNRQFFFNELDLGKSKAQVVAERVMQSDPRISIQGHFCRIECMPDSFYRNFDLILLGLDSLESRAWMNEMVSRIMEVESDAYRNVSLRTTTMIDCGTEGFRGHVRIISMGETACIHCMLDLYTGSSNIPMCSLQNEPRQPEQCVIYAHDVLWTAEKPFGLVSCNLENHEHMKWVQTQAMKRAQNFGVDIEFLNSPSFITNVVEHAIASLSSTNTIIAALCVSEALKLISNELSILDNFGMYNGESDIQGIYTDIQSLKPNPACSMCSVELITCPSEETFVTFFKDKLSPSIRRRLNESVFKVLGIYVRLTPPMVSTCDMIQFQIYPCISQIDHVPVSFQTDIMAHIPVHMKSTFNQEFLKNKVQLLVDTSNRTLRYVIQFTSKKLGDNL